MRASAFRTANPPPQLGLFSAMRISSIDRDRLDTITYLNAAPGGRRTEVRDLPILRALVVDLPASLDALIITADLQGRERHGHRLLGEVAADRLADLAEAGTLPPANRTGVLLAGDLWADPNSIKRGGLGDATPVWHAFVDRFRWVAGVLGNHDEMPTLPGAGCHLLDGRVAKLDGLSVGGVGGIIGSAGKANRRPAEAYTAALSRVLCQSPDVVITHCGPDVTGRKGDIYVREAFEAYSPPLAVFGHCHWDEPLGEIGTTQLCNVDGRVIVAMRS